MEMLLEENSRLNSGEAYGCTRDSFNGASIVVTNNADLPYIWPKGFARLVYF